ncbi:MAG TPA: hypothetical protein VG711_09070, partial [Phycisphaerales bacterium]|nr:hypothetical protein [Phycisphaerales bacterium]
MSRKISTTLALAASAVALAILSASAHASSSDFSLTLTDSTGFSSLSNGTFTFSDPLPFHIAGSVMQRDGNNDGFGDNPLNITYDQNLSLSPDFIILHLSPGNTVAFSDSGPLSTSFD